MGFLKFLLGGFLIVGSLFFGFALLFSTPFLTKVTGGWILWIIDFVAFMSGIYLVRRH